MLVFLVLLVIIVVAVFRTTTADERERFIEYARVHLVKIRSVVAESNVRLTPFHDALKARTRWPMATFALAALSVTVFAGVIFEAGPASSQETLLAWGGNVGPRTSRGESWRVVTAMFVHASFLPLALNVAALVQVGLLLERIVGPWTFAAVYLAAGVGAGLIDLATQPIIISYGAAAAVSGVYGLLAASLTWTLYARSAITPPLLAIRRLAPIAAVFFLTHLWDGLTSSPALVGLVVGVVAGLPLTRGVAQSKPPARRAAIAAAVTVAIAIVASVSVRGITDARPEIAQVVELEGRTATAYEEAVGRFRKGRVSAQALVDMIERTIVPELQAARARVEALDGVPAEHAPLVAGAQEYFRLRDESWRLRAEGLKKTNMRTLQEAERATAASLDALRRVAAAVETL